MRLVVDMNLSPEWVGYLEQAGHDVVHWMCVGRADAHDEDIMQWLREHDRILLTSDLDFGAMLATSDARKPSVVQLRSENTSPAQIGSLVAQALARAENDLLAGALLTLEAARSRLRILPFSPDR